MKFELFEERYDLWFTRRITDGGVECFAKSWTKGFARPGIALHTSVRGRDLLGALYHEAFHLAFPWIVENMAERVAIEASCHSGPSDTALSRVMHDICPFIESSWITQFASEVAVIVNHESIQKKLKHVNKNSKKAKATA